MFDDVRDDLVERGQSELGLGEERTGGGHLTSLHVRLTPPLYERVCAIRAVHMHLKQEFLLLLLFFFFFFSPQTSLGNP